MNNCLKEKKMLPSLQAGQNNWIDEIESHLEDSSEDAWKQYQEIKFKL